MNIVLTGFMGTGKTTVGRRLAEDLNAPFFDVDATIEKEKACSIRSIFESEGEAEFRKLETMAIERLSARDHIILSTGGGALLDANNRELLKRNGYLICLMAKAGTLLERLKDDFTRPLLAREDPGSGIERLLKKRQGVYRLCDLQIQTDQRTIAEVAQAIILGVGARWKKL